MRHQLLLSRLDQKDAEKKVEHLQKVEVMQGAFELAQKYLTEKVSGQTSSADCLHIVTQKLKK
ncbi:MAG: hypothetical protein ABI844_05235 [Saprospiraceae bacterium]